MNKAKMLCLGPKKSLLSLRLKLKGSGHSVPMFKSRVWRPLGYPGTPRQIYLFGQIQTSQTGGKSNSPNQLLKEICSVLLHHSENLQALLSGIIKGLFFNEIGLWTEDKHKDSGLYMISLIAQLKDKYFNSKSDYWKWN